MPDPSLQLAGLDKIVQSTLPTMLAVLFRVNTHREAQRLDYNPTQQGVDQLALLLISELEWSSLHAPGNESPPKPPKLPRMRRIDGAEEQGKGLGKGKGKSKDVGKDSPKGEGSPTKSQKMCKLFGKGEAGCTYGSRCRFMHDSERAKREQLCFHCSLAGHMANCCPVEAARSREQEPINKDNPQPKAKGKASARKVQGQAMEPVESSQLGPADEVLAAATKALQNLSLKMLTGPDGLELSSSCTVELPEISMKAATEVGSRGLLDGGATHALRQALPGEWERSTPVDVKLAVGQSPGVRMNEWGTLLAQNPVQSIIPVGRLTRLLKCKVQWDAKGCEVIHPSLGRLPIMLVNGCPEVPQVLAATLIKQLELEVLQA